MPRREAVPAGGYLRRRLAVLLAVTLGVVAVCLIVFSSTQKQSQIGAILGFWAGLIAAFVVFGARRAAAERVVGVPDLDELGDRVAELHRNHLEATLGAQASSELALRRLGEVQLAREAAARREADLTLELTLRREIERALADQFGTLRQEVSALRAEVVDKLGGQIKLERIETTRVIGSDLEALQNEIRRLALRQANQADAIALAARPGLEGPPGPVQFASAQTASSHPAVAVPAATPSPAPTPAPVATPEPAPDPQPSPEPALANGAASPQSAPDAWPTGQNPFANLPRLSPVSADVAELLKPVTGWPAESGAARQASQAVTEEQGRRRAPQDDPNSDLYVGRRRAAAERAARRAALEVGGRRRAPDHGATEVQEPESP